jgi:hypothetical protein
MPRRAGLVSVENRHSLLDAAEVDEVPGKVVAVRGGMGCQDGDGLLDSSNAGKQFGEV